MKSHYVPEEYPLNLSLGIRFPSGKRLVNTVIDDGEPWEEPQGYNRFLFAGKERLGIGGLNMYDFGPRMYNAAACFWYQPDPAAASYPHISPYSYCAGNPVRFVDPSGRIIEYAGADTKFIKELISKLREDKMFDEVFSMIDASKTTYTISMGNVTLPGTNTPADACFNPNKSSIWKFGIF